uniref:Transmembrane protein 19 n=1 Tax=Arcella intermedia TaxID=1963864 RepID=A0A6B2LCS9_9EUKA
MSVGVGLGGLVSYRAYKKKSLSLDGALLALVTGVSHSMVGLSPVCMLLAFFYSSSKLTKMKADLKKQYEPDHKEGGQRDWKQVASNGGLQILVCCYYLYRFGCSEVGINFEENYWRSFLISMLIGGYSTSNGDTWASEIGITSKGPVWLITTGKRVPRGTNGGISLLGTIASIGGGALIGLVYLGCACILSDSGVWDALRHQWPAVLLGTGSGFVGSMVDSLLGATLEYSGWDEKANMIVYKKASITKRISGMELLDGNKVNFISIVITAFLSAWMAPKVFQLAHI